MLQPSSTISATTLAAAEKNRVCTDACAERSEKKPQKELLELHGYVQAQLQGLALSCTHDQSPRAELRNTMNHSHFDEICPFVRRETRKCFTANSEETDKHDKRAGKSYQRRGAEVLERWIQSKCRTLTGIAGFALACRNLKSEKSSLLLCFSAELDTGSLSG